MMKNPFVQTGSFLFTCAFFVGTALAQQQTVGQTEVTTTETRTTVATPTVAVTPTVTATTVTTPTVLRLGQLQARDMSGQAIGTIEDVVVSPQGCLDMAVLSLGGTRLVPVPWQIVRTEPVAVGATAVPGPAFVTLQVDSTRLQQAPSIDRAQLRTQLTQPAFAQQVNTFFGVQAGAQAGFTGTTNLTTGRIGDTNQFGVGRTNLFPTGRTNAFPTAPNTFPPTTPGVPPGTPSTTPSTIPPSATPTPSNPDLNNPGVRPTTPPRTSTPGTVTPGTAPTFPSSPVTPRPPTTPISPTTPSSPTAPRTPSTTP